MYGYCPLASGSKGNSTYLGTSEIKVLIDAGLSLRMLSARLAEIDVLIEEIDAILVTHEHSDHIKGLKAITSKHNIPIYANSETAKGIVASTGVQPPFKIFGTGEPFSIGDVEFFPFPIQHDTPDPVAFTASHADWKIGFCTDLGFATATVRHHLQNCDYLIVEANHHPSMVYSSPRPDYLKQRILGPSGHISNDECADLIESVLSDRLKHIHLAHLSDECNTPERALEIVNAKLASLAAQIPVAIAHQHQVSQAIHFSHEPSLMQT